MTKVCEHDEACNCYNSGYVDGKVKAFFEVRMLLTDGSHDASCDCEPCKLLRAIRTADPDRPAWSVVIEDQ